MRVLHLTTDLAGGAGVAARRLHEGLLKRGVESHIAFRSPSHNTLAGGAVDQRHQSFLWRARASWAIQRLWKSVRPDTPLFTNPGWIFPSTLRSVWDQVADPDIVHLHWVSRWLDLNRFLTSIPSRIPIVWSLHDLNPVTGGCHHAGDCVGYTKSCGSCPILKRPAQRDQSAKNHRVKQKVYQVCKPHLVGNSEWTMACIQRSSLSRFARSIRTIHLGIDPGEYAPIDKNIARSALRIPADDFVIGFASADLKDKNKGLDVLLAALQRIQADNPIHLLTFGAGSLGTEINGMRITHVGEQRSTRIQSLCYSAADVFVVPSRFESFGLTALEAMACGTPVIAFRTGGLPEVVSEGQTGLLVSPVHDPLALAEAIQRFLQEPSYAQRLGQNARTRAQSEFSAERTTERYFDLYAEISTKTTTA